MAINFRTDYSFLFSSMNQSSGGFSMNSWLSDYTSIKNGSYGKLMKAYYSVDNSSKSGKSSSSNSIKDIAKNNSIVKETITKEDAKKLNKVQTTTDALKESADALLKTGNNSVFAQKDITTKDENGLESTIKGYDVDAIYKAVNKFVQNYNSVVNAVDDANVDSVTRRAQNMVNQTSYNEKALNKIGITMNDDGTLSIDKDTFTKADMNNVKSLFNGSGSYGYQISAQASMTNYAADRAASRSNTYTGNGTYDSFLNSGNIYNSYF